jgi:hypothetical protein
VKTAAHIRVNGPQLLDSEKQLSRSNVVSAEGRLKRIFPIAPLVAGLSKSLSENQRKKIKLMYLKFYKLVIIEDSPQPFFLFQTGIMEWWNDGMKELKRDFRLFLGHHSVRNAFII